MQYIAVDKSLALFYQLFWLIGHRTFCKNTNAAGVNIYCSWLQQIGEVRLYILLQTHHKFLEQSSRYPNVIVNRYPDSITQYPFHIMVCHVKYMGSRTWLMKIGQNVRQLAHYFHTPANNQLLLYLHHFYIIILPIHFVYVKFQSITSLLSYNIIYSILHCSWLINLIIIISWLLSGSWSCS